MNSQDSLGVSNLQDKKMCHKNRRLRQKGLEDPCDQMDPGLIIIIYSTKAVAQCLVSSLSQQVLQEIVSIIISAKTSDHYTPSPDHGMLLATLSFKVRIVFQVLFDLLAKN